MSQRRYPTTDRERGGNLVSANGRRTLYYALFVILLVTGIGLSIVGIQKTQDVKNTEKQIQAIELEQHQIAAANKAELDALQDILAKQQDPKITSDTRIVIGAMLREIIPKSARSNICQDLQTGLWKAYLRCPSS